MKARAVTTVLLVVLAAVAVVGPVVVAGDGPTDEVAPRAASVAPANNSTMGQEVSTFMQSSAGETDESVESGMWDAAYENATGDAKADVVEGRIDDVRERLENLEQRKQALKAARENGTISEAAYRAKMSRLVGEMAALNRSVERTDRQAQAVGANRSAVDELRQLANDVVGSEMAAIAKDIGGGVQSDLPDRSNSGETGPPERDNRNGSENCPRGQSDDEECSDGNGDDSGGPPDDGGPPDGGQSGTLR